MIDNDFPIFAKLPPANLDGVANEWREFLRGIKFTVQKDITLHQDGTHSVYVIHITLVRERTKPITFYYVGSTTDPNARANKHKSEIQTCKTTTFTGKARLYDPLLMIGLTEIQISFVVTSTGHTKDQAAEGERMLALDLRQEYGEKVLTSPTGKKPR